MQLDPTTSISAPFKAIKPNTDQSAKHLHPTTAIPSRSPKIGSAPLRNPGFVAAATFETLPDHLTEKIADHLIGVVDAEVNSEPAIHQIRDLLA